MVHGFVLVDCGAGVESDVAASVGEMAAVTEARVVAGDFDVVVEIEGETVRDLLRTITGEIRSLDGVGTTKTYVSLE